MNKNQELNFYKNIFIDKIKGSAMKSKENNQDIQTIIIPKTLESEFNFLRFPFFDLSNNSKRDRLEIKEIIVSEEGEKMEIYWKVSRDIDTTFPGIFDKDVHRTIEQILNKL